MIIAQNHKITGHNQGLNTRLIQHQPLNFVFWIKKGLAGLLNLILFFLLYALKGGTEVYKNHGLRVLLHLPAAQTASFVFVTSSHTSPLSIVWPIKEEMEAQ